MVRPTVAVAASVLVRDTFALAAADRVHENVVLVMVGEARTVQVLAFNWV